MYDCLRVQVVQRFAQLQGDALDLRFGERHLHVVEQYGQVLLAKLHYRIFLAPPENRQIRQKVLEFLNLSKRKKMTQEIKKREIYYLDCGRRRPSKF